MSIERFQACLAVTLEFEGGYSNDPNDAGGATNLGIEFKEWNAYKDSIGEPRSTLEEFANDLTPADVEPIYLANYWEQINDGSLPAPVDMVAFDTAVLEGVGKAQEFLAATANEANPETRAGEMQGLRKDHFWHIVASNQADTKFLRGWLNRVDELSAKIKNGEI